MSTPSDQQQRSPTSTPPARLVMSCLAWSSVAGAFLVQFCTVGILNASGIFQWHYKTSIFKEQSSSELAWISSLQAFLVFILSPTVAKILQVNGCRIVVLSFSCMAACGILLLVISGKYLDVMLAQGMIFGVATAGLSLPSMVMADQWFSTDRRAVAEIVSAGGSLGGIFYSYLIHTLLQQTNFLMTAGWMFIVQIAFLVFANIFYRSPDYLPERGNLHETSNYVGVRIREPSILGMVFFIAGCFLTTWGVFIPWNYLPEMASLNGLEGFAHYTLVVANGGSLIGRIAVGWASSMIGSLNAFSIVTFICGTLVLTVWLLLEYYTSSIGILAFAFLYGLFSGGCVNLGPPSLVALHTVYRLDIFSIAIALGALTGLPIAGAIKDKQGGKLAGLICFAGASMLLAAICMVIARVFLVGRQLSKKI